MAGRMGTRLAPAALLVAAALALTLALEPLVLVLLPPLAGPLALAAPLLRGPQIVSNMAQYSSFFMLEHLAMQVMHVPRSLQVVRRLTYCMYMVKLMFQCSLWRLSLEIE